MRKNKKWTFQFVNFTICYEEINSTVHWTSLGRDGLFGHDESAALCIHCGNSAGTVIGEQAIANIGIGTVSSHFDLDISFSRTWTL